MTDEFTSFACHLSTSPNGPAAISCGWRGARYHVWLDPTKMEVRPDFRNTSRATLYRNPPVGVGRGDAGWFATRHLDAAAKTNRVIVDRLLAEAPRLVAEARAEAARHAEVHREKMEAAEHTARVALAAPRMLAALQLIGSLPVHPADDARNAAGLERAVAAAWAAVEGL